MAVADHTKSEVNAYGGKPLEDMTLQDALIAIGVYAAREIEQSEGTVVQRVAERAGQHPLFKESDESLRARINHVTNQMRTEKPQALLSRAARSLTPELRETAFKWASSILDAHTGLSAKKRAVLKQLQVTLAIAPEQAEQITGKYDFGD
jgi:hypothetical protein